MSAAAPGFRNRTPRRMSTGRAVVIALALSALAVLPAAALAAAMGPRDFARSIPGVRRLEGTAKKLGLAYPAHVALGTAFSIVGASQKATDQWIRAAWHAETAAEIDRVAHELVRARQRDGGDAALDAELCALRQKGLPAAEAILARANLRC